MRLKRLVELSPLIGAFLIFNGFLRLYLFYDHWGIRIIDYLDFSEILLSFFTDMNVIIIFFVLLVIQSFAADNLFTIADKKIAKLDNEDKADTITEKGSFTRMAFEYNLNKRKKEALITTIIGETVAIICFIIFNNIFCMYLVIIGAVGVFDLLFSRFLRIKDSVSGPIIFSLLFITCTVCLTRFEYNRTEEKAGNKLMLIATAQGNITTSSTNYVIGKTKNYLFLHNSVEKKITIISNTEIKRIEIVTIR